MPFRPKRLARQLANRLGYDITIYRPPPPVYTGIPDAALYRPFFSPWLGYGDFQAQYDAIKPYTLVAPDKSWVLRSTLQQALALSGDCIECGVYRGGTAMLMAQTMAQHAGERKTLHLFDTFAGMPETDPTRDLHREGDFGDTSLTEVRARFTDTSFIEFHQGFIPETFAAIEKARLAFAHVDVDIYESVWDCCEFIYPRLVAGGFIVFDDYGAPSCPGARQAVDTFFANKPEVPLCLPTGQAVLFKAP